MKRSCILTATVFAITAGLSTATLADSSATLNQCWGDIASQMGQFGAMGLHSAASSPFNPTPAAGPNAPTNAGPRLGVANASPAPRLGLEPTLPGEGGIGEHAVINGSLVDNVPGGLPTNTGTVLTQDLICD